jgi:hypothetical protein
LARITNARRPGTADCAGADPGNPAQGIDWNSGHQLRLER